MAERYDFYVHDNRKVTFNLSEPIMREDSGVTDFVFHIPKILNELEVSDWQWWFVFVNAKKEKYSIALTLSDDPESPLEKNVATYTVDYAMSIKAGSVQFALEAINAGTGGAIDNEWHTLTYETKVKETLQGNQAEYAETESDIISALMQEVQRKVNSLVGGATPLPVNLKSLMTDPQKVYLYTGTEQGEYTGNWYYHNDTQFVPGGVYGAGVTDAVPTQGSTNAVQSGGVYSALDGKIDKSSILVEDHGESEQVTLTNTENASDFYENLSSKMGFAKTSLLDGIALFTSTANSDPNPYIRHDFTKGTGKWLVGCKVRFTKVDSTLENPTSFRVTIGSSTAKDFAVSWNTWIDYSNVAEIDLTRMAVSARGFSSARTAGQFTLEVKDLYIYEVTGVSDEMIAEIQSEQSSNYQDGTVTYGEASTTSYIPDVTLLEPGKVPDSKAVGDAIALAQSTAEEKAEEAVSRINTKIADVISETSVTLTNARTLSNITAQNGLRRDSITENLAVFSPSTSTDVSPSVRDACTLGTGKWLVGFKFKVTKNDVTLGDPEMYRLILGANKTHDFAVVYDTWVNVCEVSDVNLTRVYFMLRNYATAPTAGQITLEVKDYYVYEVSDLSADLLNYIKNQQETAYTDGEVTYTVSEIADPIRLNLGRVNAKNYGIKGDGITDDTSAINAMFSAVGSGNYYFPAGTYLFSGTIYLPADSMIYGDGDTTVFQLADTHNLSQESFRGSSGGWHPYFDAVNIDNLNIRKIKIVGSNNLDNARHAAILLKWCKKCSVSEVTVYNVNFDDNQVADATVSGYGIAVDMSEKCSVEKCYVERCGYECIGVVDLCSDCVVRDCITKNGWRTCIQIHRGSKRTIVDNCWMEETHNACDACFTIHGLTDVNLVEDVRVTNCTMIYPSGITQAYDYNAPVQCMSHTNRFWFCNNRIYGGRRALYVDASFADVFVCNNEMYCDSDSDYGVKIQSAEAIIIGNRLKNDASSPVNVIASGAVISANIGIS